MTTENVTRLSEHTVEIDVTEGSAVQSLKMRERERETVGAGMEMFTMVLSIYLQMRYINASWTRSDSREK